MRNRPPTRPGALLREDVLPSLEGQSVASFARALGGLPSDPPLGPGRAQRDLGRDGFEAGRVVRERSATLARHAVEVRPVAGAIQASRRSRQDEAVDLSRGGLSKSAARRGATRALERYETL